METINGIGNWKLTVRRSANEIAILRAVTCDKAAVMPDELFGLPVRVLGDHALACSAAPAEGERVQMICGVPEGEFDNRCIESLTLPRQLREIGSYALLDCRSLCTLELNDCLSDIGVSVFMNCRSFDRLRIIREQDAQGPALSCIVRELSRELDAEVSYCGGEVLRLIFPEYSEVQTENEPTHFFNYTIQGAGYPYRHIFVKGHLNTADFDALWRKYLSMEHSEDEALRLAWYRLRYPHGLSEGARRDYAEYISANIHAALCLTLRERDMAGLHLLLDTAEPGRDALDHALSIARKLRFTEATGILLEQQHRRLGRVSGRCFEL